jgi:periplasmic protein CpxP/Spy
MNGTTGWLKAGRLGLVLVAAGLSVACAGAQGPPPDGAIGMGPHRPPMERALGPMGQFGRWWNNPRIVDKYKLTDSQRKSMDDIYQQHRMNLIDLHANLEKAEAGMEPLIGQDQPDENKILAQIDQVAQARAELEKANARMLLDLRRQLTPEQWKDLKAAWAERHEAGGPGAHWRGRGGPGGNAVPAPNGPDGTPPPNGPGEE